VFLAIILIYGTETAESRGISKILKGKIGLGTYSKVSPPWGSRDGTPGGVRGRSHAQMGIWEHY